MLMPAGDLRTDRKRKPGRPRSERADRAILETALALLAEGGFGRLSVEGVAARAGVGKTTIYRRWKTKTDLVLAAMHALVDQEIRVPDTGSTRSDLVEMVAGVIRAVTRTAGGRILTHLAAESRSDPRLASALRAFWAARRDLTFRVLSRGIERGDLPRDLDLDLTADLLYGAVYSRYLFTGQPLDRGVAERIVDAVLRSGGARRDDARGALA